MIRRAIISVLALGITLCASSVAHALERVNLITGFSYDCTHREPLGDGNVRLYLYSPTTAADANFIVVASRYIASVETLPDPPPAAPKPPATELPKPAGLPELLANAGVQHNIDVELLASVVKTESGGHPHAVSRTGARGLMQLMPGTARDLGVEDAFQPDQNIAGGSAYLDSLLTRYHNNLSFALAAYNAGPAAVDRYHGVPPYRETRAYVARVENEFIRRKNAALKASRLSHTKQTEVVAQR